MSEPMDKAVEAVLEDMTLPDDAEERALWRGRTVHILQVALPHLEAHFREVFAKELEVETERRFPKRRFEETECYHACEWDNVARYLRTHKEGS